VLGRSIWSDPALFSLSQAGLVNNLNDGLAWGLFPLLFTASGLSLREMSVLAALYPATWSIGQLVSGSASDRWGRKPFIVAGMLIQGASLFAVTMLHGFTPWAASLVMLGIGTALVYPTLIAAVGDIAHPSWRGVAVGVYRLWRDLGYVVGALLAGALSDLLGIPAAIDAVAALTVISGVTVAIRFHESGASRH
jgi:MFS family permease